MSFEITGKLYRKFDTEEKTSSFKAREFVIEINEGNYPQFIKFQLTQDRCALIDNIGEGESIKVFFDLRGREWNEKFFTNLNAWKIESDSPTFSDESSLPEPTLDEVPPQSDIEDDLPF